MASPAHAPRVFEQLNALIVIAVCAQPFDKVLNLFFVGFSAHRGTSSGRRRPNHLHTFIVIKVRRWQTLGESPGVLLQIRLDPFSTALRPMCDQFRDETS